MTVRPLDAPPNLPRTLVRGALASLRKRGPWGEHLTMPAERLVLPSARCDPRRLRAYAEVCGFPADSPHLPPAYPHLLGFPLAMQLMAQPSFPFPLLGLVHTAIRISGVRTLHADERPDISVHIEEPRPHRRGTVFDVVTEARTDGEPVWHSRSTYLCRHPRPEPGEAGAAAPPAETAPAPEEPLPVAGSWELPSGLGRRYAAASGDRNPIHLHPLTARPFGFPRHIVHGMWTFARCLAAVQGPAESGRFTARAEFRAPLPLPAAVTFRTAPDPEDCGTAFEVRGGPGRDGTPRLHLTGSLYHSGTRN